MLRTNFKRTFTRVPNRRRYSATTTSTSPAPSTHNDKNLPVKPVTPLEPQSSLAALKRQVLMNVDEVHQRNFPAHTQDSFPKVGAKRPHLNIEINPNHGLWHFFRLLRFEEGKSTNGRPIKRRTDDNASSKNAVWRRVSHEDKDPIRSISGRSWSAAELRRKSFKDLHTLWYLVLRERNLLATQIQENRRALLPQSISDLMNERAKKCRKTQARIKLVLSERRRGYERAIKSLPGGLAKWRKERWGTSAIESDSELSPETNPSTS